MSYYSHSQIGTYLTCPLKYKYDKIDGLGKQTKESSLSLILGTAVHAALEFVYKQRTNLKTPTIDQMMQRYTLTFTNECKESTTEFVDEDRQVFFGRGKTYLERYRSVYFPFDQAITMAVEQSFSITLDEQISFSGYIDRIDVDGDRLILVDYKTSKKLEPDDADTHRQQLTLYALGMKQKYGSKFTIIEARLIYLHLQKEVVRTVTDDQLAHVTQRYLTHAQQIEDARETLAKNPADPEAAFPAIVWSHCEYCPFQMICPQWKHQYMDDELLSTELGEKTIRTMIDDYAVVQKKITQLEKEKKTIATALLDYASDKQIDKLYGNERKTSIQSRRYRSVKEDAERLLRQYAKEHGIVDELVKTDTNALAKLIEAGTIDLASVQARVDSKLSTRLGVASRK